MKLLIVSQKSKLKLKIFRMMYILSLPVRLTCDDTKTFAMCLHYHLNPADICPEGPLFLVTF